MFKALVFASIILICTCSSLAQTARVAHRSHSGTGNISFAEDNFGLVVPHSKPKPEPKDAAGAKKDKPAPKPKKAEAAPPRKKKAVPAH